MAVQKSPVQRASEIRVIKGDPSKDPKVAEQVRQASLEQQLARVAKARAGSSGNASSEYQKLAKEVVGTTIYSTSSSVRDEVGGGQAQAPQGPQASMARPNVFGIQNAPVGPSRQSTIQPGASSSSVMIKTGGQPGADPFTGQVTTSVSLAREGSAIRGSTLVPQASMAGAPSPFLPQASMAPRSVAQVSTAVTPEQKYFDQKNFSALRSGGSTSPFLPEASFERREIKSSTPTIPFGPQQFTGPLQLQSRSIPTSISELSSAATRITSSQPTSFGRYNPQLASSLFQKSQEGTLSYLTLTNPKSSFLDRVVPSLSAEQRVNIFTGQKTNVPASFAQPTKLQPTTVTAELQKLGIAYDDLDLESPQTKAFFKSIEDYNTKTVPEYNKNVEQYQRESKDVDLQLKNTIEGLSEFSNTIITARKSQQTSPGTMSIDYERKFSFDPNVAYERIKRLSPDKQAEALQILQDTLNTEAGRYGVKRYTPVDQFLQKRQESYEKGFLEPLTRGVSTVLFEPYNMISRKSADFLAKQGIVDLRGPQAYLEEQQKGFVRGGLNLVGSTIPGLFQAGAEIGKVSSGLVNPVLRANQPVYSGGERLFSGGTYNRPSLQSKQIGTVVSQTGKFALENPGESAAFVLAAALGTKPALRSASASVTDALSLRKVGSRSAILGEDIVQTKPSGSRNVAVSRVTPEGRLQTDYTFEPRSTSRGIGITVDEFENRLGTRMDIVRVQGLEAEMLDTRLTGRSVSSQTGVSETVQVKGLGTVEVRSTLPETVIVPPSTTQNILRQTALLSERKPTVAGLLQKQTLARETGIALPSITRDLNARRLQAAFASDTSLVSGQLRPASTVRVLPEFELTARKQLTTEGPVSRTINGVEITDVSKPTAVDVITGEGKIKTISRAKKQFPEERTRLFSTEQTVQKGLPVEIVDDTKTISIGTKQFPSRVLSDTEIGTDALTGSSVVQREIAATTPQGLNIREVLLRTERSTPVSKVTAPTPRKVELRGFEPLSERILPREKGSFLFRDVDALVPSEKVNIAMLQKSRATQRQLDIERARKLQEKPAAISQTQQESKAVETLPVQVKDQTFGTVSGSFASPTQRTNIRAFLEENLNPKATGQTTVFEKPQLQAQSEFAKAVSKTDVSSPVLKSVLRSEFETSIKSRPPVSALKTSGKSASVLATASVSSLASVSRLSTSSLPVSRISSVVRPKLITGTKLTPQLKTIVEPEYALLPKTVVPTAPIQTIVPPLEPSVFEFASFPPAFIPPVGGGGPSFNFGSLPTSQGRRTRERTITNKLKDITQSTLSGTGLQKAIGIIK